MSDPTYHQEYEQVRRDALDAALEIVGEHFGNVLILASTTPDEDAACMWERAEGSAFAATEMCRARVLRWEAHMRVGFMQEAELDDDEAEV